jgi:hypothetical protein
VVGDAGEQLGLLHHLLAGEAVELGGLSAKHLDRHRDIQLGV